MMEYKALSFVSYKRGAIDQTNAFSDIFVKNYLSLFRGRVAPLIFAGVAQ